MIKLAQQGQVEAFRQLFVLHRQRIFSLAYSYLRNPQDAEDVLQETFIKAYQAMPSFQLSKGLSFSSWLSRIGINCCLDLLRQRKAQQRKETSLASWSSNPTTKINSTHNPESREELQTLREKIECLLDELPPRQRMVFILRHYQDYSIREIAEDMGVTEGTVKRMLFRAFGTIKKNLKKILMEKSYEMS